ncbi:hypothetical protein SAMN02745136_01851 [Anaerocolumna jejuensis DSM 15929]|uniref:Uncharacterized protein n=1 Tax=Anaerocolumna jejuensis DSM 15929 TaxID=1121322 RepID=A0A1M6Q3M7_9FIRM|nr:hypothetical protein SAMN02745136_01851 [Anaerocolumna jejuensis DSM 15929]
MSVQPLNFYTGLILMIKYHIIGAKVWRRSYSSLVKGLDRKVMGNYSIEEIWYGRKKA